MAMTGTGRVTLANAAKYSGKVLDTQAGSLMRRVLANETKEKHIAMR